MPQSGFMPTSRPATQWRLAPHVRACDVDGQVILLDLLSNKYLGVMQRPGLAAAIGGWPANTSHAQLDASHVDGAVPPAPLMARNLLTTRLAHNDAPAAVVPPSASLDVDPTLGRRAIGPRRLFYFLTSAACAAASLRYRSLQAIAVSVRARRGSTPPWSGTSLPRAVHESVAAYFSLRPLLYTPRDQCLFDSLALLGFMAAEGLCPQWVIGVRTRPFAAHSWVQAGHTVLNDQHDHVRQYRPILVV